MGPEAEQSRDSLAAQPVDPRDRRSVGAGMDGRDFYRPGDSLHFLGARHRGFVSVRDSLMRV